MHHIATDETQLGSHVVRVYRADSDATAGDLSGAKAPGGTLFFAHVFLKAGETLHRWRKVSYADIGPIPRLLWCKCSDVERQADTAKEWWIWATNEPMTRVGDRWDVLAQSELGMVINPNAILERAETGRWSIKYPAKPKAQPEAC